MKVQSLKRLTAGLLAALMIVTLLPTFAWAATTVDSGSCGENLCWTLDDAGTLTISGTGEMEDYTYSDRPSWDDHADSIQTVVIQQGVTTIGGSAFNGCTSLSSVTIPDGVTDIRYYAFERCTGLSSIRIPDSVTDIGENAFSGCTSLSSIRTGGGITHIGNRAFFNTAYENNADNWTKGVLYLGVYLLKAREDITRVDIRSDTKLIADYAFINCSLHDAAIPDGVTGIGESAFAYCGSLYSVSIPGSVTYIGEGAFANCYGLSRVSIPDSVTSIGDAAFFYCGSLSSLTIPASVTSIGERVFLECGYLKSFSVDAGNPRYSSADGVLFNKAKTELLYYPAGRWGSYTVPSSVTSIADYAFATCDGLTGVTIPDSVTDIGEGAFQECDDLKYASMGRGVTNIGKWAFIRCSSLTSANIPGNVTGISWRMFSGCRSLTSVTIPRSVNNIDCYAFEDCEKLTNVYYTGTKTQWGKIAIEVGNDYLLSAAIHHNWAPADPPLSSSIVSSTGKIKLTWSAVDGAAKYYIYRSTDGGKNYKYYDSTTKTSYTNLSVTPGKTYYYKVKSVAADGTMSGYSNVTYRTADCAAPKISSSIITSTGRIKLTWSAIDGASKYYIYRSTDGGKTYKHYDTTTKTSYTNQSVTPGRTYYYKVVAVCGKSSYGNSAYSNVAYRTADCARPDVSISRSNGKPRLTWKAVEGAKEYVIYRAGYRDGTYIRMHTTTRLSYTNTGAKAGYTYYYKVVAVCKLSSYGNSAYSNTVSIKSK